MLSISIFEGIINIFNIFIFFWPFIQAKFGLMGGWVMFRFFLNTLLIFFLVHLYLFSLKLTSERRWPHFSNINILDLKIHIYEVTDHSIITQKYYFFNYYWLSWRSMSHSFIIYHTWFEGYINILNKYWSEVQWNKKKSKIMPLSCLFLLSLIFNNQLLVA